MASEIASTLNNYVLSEATICSSFLLPVSRVCDQGAGISKVAQAQGEGSSKPLKPN